MEDKTINTSNDFLVYNNSKDKGFAESKDGYMRWKDKTLVIHSFEEGQTEEEIMAEHELDNSDIIVFADKLPKKIKAELINQIKKGEINERILC